MAKKSWEAEMRISESTPGAPEPLSFTQLRALFTLAQKYVE